MSGRRTRRIRAVCLDVGERLLQHPRGRPPRAAVATESLLELPAVLPTTDVG